MAFSVLPIHLLCLLLAVFIPATGFFLGTVNAYSVFPTSRSFLLSRKSWDFRTRILSAATSSSSSRGQNDASVDWDWEAVVAGVFQDDDRPVILFDGQVSSENDVNTFYNIIYLSRYCRSDVKLKNIHMKRSSFITSVIFATAVLTLPSIMIQTPTFALFPFKVKLGNRSWSKQVEPQTIFPALWFAKNRVGPWSTRMRSWPLRLDSKARPLKCWPASVKLCRSSSEMRSTLTYQRTDKSCHLTSILENIWTARVGLILMASSTIDLYQTWNK